MPKGRISYHYQSFAPAGNANKNKGYSWSCTKSRGGEDIETIYSKNTGFRDHQDAMADAAHHARKAIQTAERFDRMPPEILPNGLDEKATGMDRHAGQAVKIRPL